MDTRTRELERLVGAGDREAKKALLAQNLRTERWTLRRVRDLAILGDETAREHLGSAPWTEAKIPRTQDNWTDDLAGLRAVQGTLTREQQSEFIARMSEIMFPEEIFGPTNPLPEPPKRQFWIKPPGVSRIEALVALISGEAGYQVGEYTRCREILAGVLWELGS